MQEGVTVFVGGDRGREEGQNEGGKNSCPSI